MAAEKTQIVIVSKSGSLSECIVETNKEATLDDLTNILSCHVSPECSLNLDDKCNNMRMSESVSSILIV